MKDRVDKGEINVEYCPTYQMLADYFTKPLQGRMFDIYRQVLMGWKHISTLKTLKSPCMKERVENNIKNVLLILYQEMKIPIFRPEIF